MSRDDRLHWDEIYEARAAEAASASRARPEPFLVENAPLLRPGRTIDLAAGSGRNAQFLAALGHRVLAVDAARRGLIEIRHSRLSIDIAHMDLDHPGFRRESADNVLCINFLDRALFPEIRLWLRPGGMLVVDTFLIDQRMIGHPRDPAHLLGHNELLHLLDGFRILRYREGKMRDSGEPMFRAGAVAEKN